MSESFEDYGRLLSNSSYFSYATKNFSNDPSKFLLYIWARGYATSKDYFFSSVDLSRSIAQRLGDPSLEIKPTAKEMRMAENLSELTPGVNEERAQEVRRLLEK
jgi:flagellum-specific peptidoglycan hydrolase FlgJ